MAVDPDILPMLEKLNERITALETNTGNVVSNAYANLYVALGSRVQNKTAAEEAEVVNAITQFIKEMQ